MNSSNTDTEVDDLSNMFAKIKPMTPKANIFHAMMESARLRCKQEKDLKEHNLNRMRYNAENKKIFNLFSDYNKSKTIQHDQIQATNPNANDDDSNYSIQLDHQSPLPEIIISSTIQGIPANETHSPFVFNAQKQAEENLENNVPKNTVTNESKIEIGAFNKYRRYSDIFKQKALDAKIRYGTSYASLKFQVPASTVNSWQKRYTDLKVQEDQRKHNHRPFDIKLENQILEFFVEMRNKHLPVTCTMLQLKAKEFNRDPNFKASNGWLYKFMRRNKIAKRQKTHIIQKLCENYADSVLKYFHEIDRIQKSHNNDVIFLNFDEIPCSYDFAREFTLNFQGEKEINILSHNHSKYNFSLCPTISSTGEIINSLVVFLYAPNPNKDGETRAYPKKFEYFKNTTNPIMARFSKSGFNHEKNVYRMVRKDYFSLLPENAMHKSQTHGFDCRQCVLS